MTDMGEGIAVSVPEPPEQEEESKKEPCKRIYLHAFRGDRSQAFMADFNAKMQSHRDGTGPPPSMEEVLLWSGHVGVSFESQSPIFGFNPNPTDPMHVVLDKLKAGDGYPGHVTDDTSTFEAAKSRGLSVVTIEYVYPESKYNEIKARFDAERSASSYDYSFPGGSGDCNCATFPARLGIPIPEATGNMKFYMAAMQQADTPRRMGDCEG